MGRFRLLIVLFITWLVLAMNIERPDSILNLGQINISSQVYVISAFAVGIVLLVPKLSTSFTMIQITLLVIVYLFSDLPSHSIGDLASDYVTYVEIAMILVTFWGVRKLSEAIVTFRKAIDHAVLGSAKLGFQTFIYDDDGMENGNDNNLENRSILSDEQIISEEMLRARRYNQSFALFSVRIEGLPKSRFGLNSYWDSRIMLENLYMRTYIVQLLQDLVLGEGDIAVWHQDDLLIGLPQTDHAGALDFVQNLEQSFEVLMDSSPSISFAIFPDDALVYSDLVEAANANHEAASQAVSDTVKKATGQVSQIHT